MKLIVGLGNPGPHYAATRHNVGFRTVDRIAAAAGWAWSAHRDRAELASGLLEGMKIVLAKPQTYMNDSGIAVGALVRFYKIDLADLLVICDDLDLPVGRVRLRARGSSGGQHGMESIIARLGSSDFARLRIGIGRPATARRDTISYVLGVPHGDERELLDNAERLAAEAALTWAREGVQVAMNRYNVDPNAPPKTRPQPDPAAETNA
jgi:PTH1 family peptidyl-tRNA hydrolase